MTATAALPAFAYGSPEWVTDRRNYIGASDVPMLLGHSPYGSPYDLWLLKQGLAEVTPNAAMEWGHLLEPLVAKKYQEVFPDVGMLSVGTIPHATLPILCATLDRMVIGEHDDFPLEIKTTSAYLGETYGDIGTDAVPDHVFLQVQAQLEVCDKPFAHVAVLVGGNDFRAPYVVERDRSIGQMIVDGVHEFWTRYMVGTEEPPITGANAQENLKRKYQEHSQLMLTADADASEWLEHLFHARTMKESAEEAEEAAKTALMAIIGADKGIIGAAGRVTWSAQQGRETLDAKGLIAHLKVPADIVAQYTRRGAPFRVFRPTAAK